ncbi:MAG: phosphoribosyltransferase family protein, partial [Polyangiales bacterium]
MKPFQDRVDAGRKLSQRLLSLREESPVVLALPKGGVPVAREVAVALRAPFEVVREERSALKVVGRTVVLVDDGVVTGETARAAIRSVKERGARRVVLAVPVGPSKVLAALGDEADVVCLVVRAEPIAIESWYDETLRAPVRVLERAVTIPFEDACLRGDLALPLEPRGLVIFAHGSGSSRKSPRNRLVANVLQRAQFATLLFDLLTIDEEALEDLEGRFHFDLETLAERLDAVTDWARDKPEVRGLPIGYFGASTGAAAALRAAAARQDIQAVV